MDNFHYFEQISLQAYLYSLYQMLAYISELLENGESNSVAISNLDQIVRSLRTQAIITSSKLELDDEKKDFLFRNISSGLEKIKALGNEELAPIIATADSLVSGIFEQPKTPKHNLDIER